MANWRDTILKHFQPKISRLTLVADPDGLLTEEGMLSAIRDRGFDLIPFDDPIAFRFAYESQYRSQWDQGPEDRLGGGPAFRRAAVGQAALRSAARPGGHLTFALHQLFPKLNYPVIAGLDRSLPGRHRRGVPEARRRAVDRAGNQGVRADALLQHRAEAHQDAGRSAEGAAVAALPQGSPADFLVEYLLESLTKDASLRDVAAGRHSPQPGEVSAVPPGRVETSSSPRQDDPSQRCRVPFSHEDVRAYIDTFFLDGSLTPVEQENVRQLARLGADGRGPRSQGRRHAPVPRSVAEVRGRNSQRRRVAPGLAASGPALGGTGRPALGVGRGAGRRRPNGLERIAGDRWRTPSASG